MLALFTITTAIDSAIATAASVAAAAWRFIYSSYLWYHLRSHCSRKNNIANNNSNQLKYCKILQKQQLFYFNIFYSIREMFHVQHFHEMIFLSFYEKGINEIVYILQNRVSSYQWICYQLREDTPHTMLRSIYLQRPIISMSYWKWKWNEVDSSKAIRVTDLKLIENNF